MASANAFAEIMGPSASASSSTPTKGGHYDVFINHRGPDTKQTLAASIYRALKLMGVEVFLDEPELDLGDSISSEIQQAIATSFLHIAILSPRYAQSTWCLEELSLMLKSGQKVIPLFYNVDVNDIRWIKGRYAEEFSKLEAKNRYRPEKIGDWKSALQTVSYLKGYIVTNEDDAEVLKIIANYVLAHPKKTAFVMPEHPVGLDKTLKQFERSMLESSENVTIVGITGIGGCGKTTLAKGYYNKKIRSFYRCSFVSDVRDAPTKNLYTKQKKMFEDLGGSKDISFDSVEEGKAILAEYLRFVQVFIILDNVDHRDQLEALLPTKSSLTKGSVIVVTSRESGLLKSWGIPSNSIYKMKDLNPEQAMELFCWHAFDLPSPINEFESLVKKFLEVCKGSPLAIKVLGALVYNEESKEYWYGQLKKFSGLLHRDIKDVLMVSFNALDEQEKETFLDISCFFIGTAKESAIPVWEESGSLETLIKKCLVEVDEEQCLRMHDLLRDLGRVISKTESPLRLWSPEQITHIFENQGEVSIQIRGIKVQTDESYSEVMDIVRESGRGIKRKRALKILDVENCFTEELAELSEGLVFLRWANIPHPALPVWIPLKKLRVLELPEASKLEEPWNESADPPVQLIVLKIINATNVQRLPRSIGLLKHLKEISIDGEGTLINTICFDGEGAPIEGLPDEFCSLQSLERLKLVGCQKLKSLPSKIGDLTKLSRLTLKKCPEIKCLPESFCRLQSLEYLQLSQCYNLKSLPTKFGDLRNLKELILDGCGQLMISSETLMQLASLSNLKIENCPVLTEFVTQPGCFSSSFCSVKHLELSGYGLSRISISPHCCSTLESLYLHNNYDLVEIDSLPISVKKVCADLCPKLQSMSLCGLVNLEVLDMRFCWNLRKIEGLQDCSSLEALTIDDCGDVPAKESLKHMKSLSKVKIESRCHISTFEACLQTLEREKWPSECTICYQTGPGVEEIVKSFSFSSDLTLVNSFQTKTAYKCGPKFVFSKERSINAAVMICVVINAYGGDTLKVTCVKDFEDSESFWKTKGKVILSEGEYVCIGVVTPSSLVGTEVAFSLPDDLVEMGILAMGEENKVVDAFYGLVQHLAKARDISQSA